MPKWQTATYTLDLSVYKNVVLIFIEGVHYVKTIGLQASLLMVDCGDYQLCVLTDQRLKETKRMPPVPCSWRSFKALCRAVRVTTCPSSTAGTSSWTSKSALRSSPSVTKTCHTSDLFHFTFYAIKNGFFKCIHFIITFGKCGPPYLGKATAAVRAALPSPTSAWWIFLCFCNPLNSDGMNYRIFKLRMWSFLCVRIHTGIGQNRKRVRTTFLTQKNSHNFFLCSRPGSNPLVFGSRVWRSTNWAIPSCPWNPCTGLFMAE